MNLFLRIVICLFIAVAARAVPRVALMNFSTDDNSYRSMEAAANFTALLQARLSGNTNIEWVEREQLDRIRKEMELSPFESSPIKQGKLAKADWIITGQFSLDDRNRRTLFLEITDLQHAGVLASRTIVVADSGRSEIALGTNKVEMVASDLSNLLAEANAASRRMANQILIAPLFLADVTRFGGRGNEGLENVFRETLEHLAATNGRVQIIHFPKAYQAIDESEMVFDGMVEADRDAWQRAADLYVWGTYTSSTSYVKEKPQQKLEIALHLWDGASEPENVTEEITNASPVELNSTLIRLAEKVIARSQRRGIQTDPEKVRRQIAKSLVQAYNDMTQSSPHFREELGLNDPDKFLQAVHMLGAACFFDPDNAEARVLYITCRWGWWMDFTFKVKNEFWSKWRRSQAWAKYVNRFGLKPVGVELPFPYQQEGGIAETYLRSLEDVIEMFPQWHSTNEMALEDEWQKQGVHTWLTEAELYGFPKEMPHDLAWNWKKELQGEYWNRLTEVSDFIGEDWMPQGKMPPSILSILLHSILEEEQPASARLALVEKIWPKCVIVAQKYGKQWVGINGQENLLTKICAQAGKPERANELLTMLSQNQTMTTTRQASNHVATVAPQSDLQMVPTPDWLKETMNNILSMFELMPPSVLPREVKPDFQEIQFPNQFDVQSVLQMERLPGKLLVLAMDERSAPSSDSNPGVSAEMLEQRNRLWTVDDEKTNAILYKPELFSDSVHSFLLKDDRLWVAGKKTGCLDLKTGNFRQFDLSDGFDIQPSDALAFAGGNLFAAGMFKLSRFDFSNNRWANVRLPSASLSAGTGIPCLLSGDRQYLAYVSGAVLIENLARDSWTNLPNAKSIQNIAVDDSGFWMGDYQGLRFYNPADKSSKYWDAPTDIEGLKTLLTGSAYGFGNSTISRRNLADLNDLIQNFLTRIQRQADAARQAKDKVDPLHLNWRIPGEVTALANDGDFLWLGIANYFGNYLLLLHKPGNSLVAYCRPSARGRISSLKISGQDVWVGISYGDQRLIHFRKDSFLSVPKSEWVSLSISPIERERLIKTMTIRDQAMYAFYAGDDAKVVMLLQNIDPKKATLEEMFLLAFSYDADGLDEPKLSRDWFNNIISRYSDSPWATMAKAALAENEQNHKVKAHQVSLLAKYDLNHDGILDSKEKLAMQNDPAYRDEEKNWNVSQLDVQAREIIKRFDFNRDKKLERDELEIMKSRVDLFRHAPPQMLAGHKILVTPLMNKNFPSVLTILKIYDTNGDGALDENEFKAFVESLQK